MKCRVCEEETRHEFTRTILGRYVCSFFYCEACGFLQAEEPYWLNEAYASAIANADTGLVWRNIFLSKILSVVLFFLFDREGRYLDVAGGYGMLTRLMRDRGFDFYWSDVYCQNLLARGFERKDSRPPFTAVTAFEVLEHLVEPRSFLEETLAQASTRTIIFSTELYVDTPPHPDAWRYYSFQTGQHIAFYQKRTLQTLAARLGLRCYSNGMVHMITDRKISPALFQLLTHPRLGVLMSQIPKRVLHSKTITDNASMIARVPTEVSDPDTRVNLS